MDPPAVPASPALPDVTPPEVSAAALSEGGPLSAARALGASLRSRLAGRVHDEAGVPDIPAVPADLLAAAAQETPATDAADSRAGADGRPGTDGRPGADDRPGTGQGPSTVEGDGTAPAHPVTTSPPPPSAPGASRTGSPASVPGGEAAPPSPEAPAASPSPPAAAAPTVSPTAPRPPAAPPSPTAPRPPAASPPDPDPDPVRPVLPAKPVAPRPVVRPTAVEDDVAGRPCPACGTPNPPGRRFCRRCAAELRPAEKPAPLPWWRTVWPFRRRTRAGSGSAFRFFVILAVVLALCAAGFLLLPAGRALIEDTRDKLGKATPVTPADVEASGAVPGHPARDTTDGLNNRYWGAPGPGASVTYTFRKPFRLVDLIITNGASTSPEKYARQARALQVDLEVTAEDGTKHDKVITLSDKPGPQTIPTGISDAKTVRLTLSSPVGLTSGRHLALAEVEFFQRS
ncbi:zinc ribbon domain-containing protein [Streptomyces sp. NPDC059454]|uniref:NADase-type glycan-binding domain-containing protein n=1 Tax=Streptomyces sp. NPDC059454 TaxID=3346836 RepID=UPI0036A78745